MKTNELMVGDWVYMKAHRGFDSQYIKVESIPDPSSDTHYGHIGSYPISDDMDFRDIEDSHLEPIPITLEILEKNGFRHEANGNYVCYVGKAKIAVQFRDKVAIQVSNEFRGKDNNGRADLVSFLRDWSDVLYVHYLQHILRLCGIDKTIEL